ncbi:hypothetical protein D3C81_1790440 [compost metagenome]
MTDNGGFNFSCRKKFIASENTTFTKEMADCDEFPVGCLIALSDSVIGYQVKEVNVLQEALYGYFQVSAERFYID